uniref:INO80 complex subunit D n=1 Tax=Molossus molossus TaxID=27622 RepID=A0A7J8FRJ9_MOLMO|nr:INO80 complex subunit D [Molossus molossus]
MYEGKHIHFSEVDNKPLCSYSPKLCKQRRLNGYAFCIRHVLEDKTAPFKQCEYVAKYNSQRCTNPIPKSEDRSRLQRLVKLCTQKHQLDTDLFPHLGLDWSEESGEELEDAEQASPYQVAWSIRETLRYERHTSDDDDTESRSSRVTQLCTYFQQKYKHLCRLERAESRQKKCRHTFRKALLQAASREPECTGQLIQELQSAACRRTSISQTKLREVEPAACSGTVKGEQCTNKALPFTRHCFQRIL